MGNCCACDSSKKQKKDPLLITTSIAIVFFYLLYFLPLGSYYTWSKIFTHSVFELINKMWWGVVIAIFFVGILENIPREMVLGIIGTQRGFVGVLKAAFAGIVLDMCNHGILLVGLKLYERGITLGQLIAFLVASPWNSFSLTIILFSLIGGYWTVVFIVLSFILAIVTGCIFEVLVARGVLQDNENIVCLPEGYNAFHEAKKLLWTVRISLKGLIDTFSTGIKDSGMIIRWLFVGILITSAIKSFVSVEMYQYLFGSSASGLFYTLIFSTIIEACSEGSTPIAADILNTAKSPGNAFAFLMNGASTDYTEIVGLKERTRSWKIALFLPLVTLPQIILISLLIN